MPTPGPLNLITDIPGVLIGHATDEKVITGVTVLKCETPMVAAADVRGGAPGTREIDVLAAENLVDRIDALALTGGSVFGLGAADGVAAELSHQGTGLRLTAEGVAIPIVPAAVLHDLGNDGDKNWGAAPPYADLGRAALKAAAKEFGLGAVGAGKGARAGVVAGGVGSASIDLGEDVLVGAIAVVNSVGSVLLPDGETYYAWPYEQDKEFGGARPKEDFDLSHPFPDYSRLKADGRLQPGANTTLAAVATSVELTNTELKRVAMMAHDGLARAIRPIHAPFDGDVVFALSGATTKAPGDDNDLSRAMTVTRIGSAAADCLARAVARGVYEALKVNP